jgi:ribosomal protein S19
LSTFSTSSRRSTRISSRPRGLQAHVHLHPPDGRQVVALAVEEEAVEHGLGGFDRGRLARTHDAVDVEQRVLTGGVLVHAQGVADVGADRDVVDVEHIDRLEALLAERVDHRHVELVAGLGVDLARLHVDASLARVAAGQASGGSRSMDSPPAPSLLALRALIFSPALATTRRCRR